MHSHDPKYVSGFGKIITRPGVIIPLADDHSTVAIGARGDSTIVLMTTDNTEFERQVHMRREIIRSLLSMHARWDKSPVAFMEKLANMAAASNAMARSAISEIHFDAGSCLFNDDMFVRTEGNDADTVIPAVALRRVCSPALDIFSKDYILKSLSSVMASFTVKSRPDAIAERRKIVASAISMLAATAARVAQLTDGRLTYVPDGHCVSVAMLKHRSDPERFRVHLVINDPIGSGWKVLGDLERSLLEKKIAVVSRLETLIEFSCKCVVHALLMRGLDSACMRRMVDSMEVPFYQPKAVGSYPEMTLLTAGNSTVAGEGSVVVTQDGLHHIHLSLTEFQVNIVLEKGSANNIVAINIEPTLSESNHTVSPSILQWYAFPYTEAPDSRRPEKSTDGNNERDRESIWDSVPIRSAASAKPQWRSSDEAVGGDSWRSKLTRLHRFYWVRTEGKENPVSADRYSSTVFDRIAAASAVVTSKAFTDRGVSNNTDFFQKLTGQALPIERELDDLINATALLCEIYGFDGNGNKPIVTLDKTDYPEGATTKRKLREIDALGDDAGYVLTLTGNAPDASSIRVIQLVKLRSFSSPARNFEEEFDELLLEEGCSSACSWYGISPATAFGYPNDKPSFCRPMCKAKGKQTTMFLFTPRCIYHTSYCYVHLYAVSEGPYGAVNYDHYSRHLTIGDGSYSADSVESQRAGFGMQGRVLLIIAALSARTHLSINQDMSARPLGITKVSYERSRGSHDKILIERDSDGDNNSSIGCKEIVTSSKLSNNPTCLKSFSTDNKIISVELLLRSESSYNRAEESEGTRGKVGTDDTTLCLSSTLEVKCSSMGDHDYFACPTEVAIRKYGVGISSPLKNKHEYDDVGDAKYEKATIIMAL
uniref:Wsv442-like protein n=1 Tax=Trachysalambria curvirostris nimavirus TaxID=2984282 RepID=A0A9C7CFU8_9VIRU|nr:MAG: wsv442-like protein [Trachysalambria curvirostris nimavirus]